MTAKGQLPYGPSKAGAEAMAKIMADEGIKEFFLKNNMPILQPTVMNTAIAFLASPASAGISSEKHIGKDMDEWLKSRLRFDLY